MYFSIGFHIFMLLNFNSLLEKEIVYAWGGGGKHEDRKGP